MRRAGASMTPPDGSGNDPPVDLEREGPQRPLPPPETAAYDPAPFRDKMRATLAGALVVLLALTILIPFVIIACQPMRAPLVHEHLGMVFTPLVALVASAVGYYFATRNTDGA